MDNLIQLAMQIVFCLLIAAILGAIIGYLLGKMSKCDNDEYEMDPKQKELNSYNKEDSLLDNDHKYKISESKESIDNIKSSVTASGAGIATSTLMNNMKDENIDLDKGIENTKEEIEQIKDKVDDLNNTMGVGQEIGVRPEAIKIPSDDIELDDLKEISGIGLKIEEVLHSLGIYHFSQIAKWNDENIDWIENYLVLKGRVKKEDWIGQAKLLSAGGHTEFSKKVRRGENRNYQ